MMRHSPRELLAFGLVSEEEATALEARKRFETKRRERRHLHEELKKEFEREQAL